MRVLGIESTCDETAAAVVEVDGNGRASILSNAILSQIAQHAVYGGVVPEIASRLHSEKIMEVIKNIGLDKIKDVDFISVTTQP